MSGPRIFAPPSQFGAGRVVQGSFAAGGPRLSPVMHAPPKPMGHGCCGAGAVQARPAGLVAPAPWPNRAVAQPRSLGNASELPQNFVATMGRLPGKPLPDSVREKMEGAFNTSFADVRVHVGPEAPAIGALAFTIGSNLYFAPGQYDPLTLRGQQILGHELTHVVQQRAGRVRNPFGGGVAVVQDPGLEAEAERMAMRVGTVQMLALPGAGVARPGGWPAGGTVQPMLRRSDRYSQLRAARAAGVGPEGQAIIGHLTWLLAGEKIEPTLADAAYAIQIPCEETVATLAHRQDIQLLGQARGSCHSCHQNPAGDVDQPFVGDHIPSTNIKASLYAEILATIPAHIGHGGQLLYPQCNRCSTRQAALINTIAADPAITTLAHVAPANVDLITYKPGVACVLATGPKVTPAQGLDIQALGVANGCHSCGTMFAAPDYIADHVPPVCLTRPTAHRLFTTFNIIALPVDFNRRPIVHLLPQCRKCSCNQGGTLSALGAMITRLDRLA